MTKRHVATETTRKQVATAAGWGLPHPQIGTLIGVSGRTIERRYAAELRMGHAKATAQVANALFTAAINGNIVAQIFWMKCRAGWREVQRVEMSGPDGTPLAPAPASVLVVPGMQTLEQWEADSTALLANAQKPQK